MKASPDFISIPAPALVHIRPKTAAGFAKLVEAVNKYPAPIHAGIAIAAR